jgi:predicted nucleic acid-binding protein
MVDTSVWIDYFNNTSTPQVERLESALGVEVAAIGDMIALEILQGFKSDKDYRIARDMIDTLSVFELLGQQTVYRCADNYRALRKKGITVRKSADSIIATFCIDNDLPLLFSDRDFLPFVEHLGLRVAA